jgi:hypothetical protein
LGDNSGDIFGAEAGMIYARKTPTGTNYYGIVPDEEDYSEVRRQYGKPGRSKKETRQTSQLAQALKRAPLHYRSAAR